MFGVCCAHLPSSCAAEILSVSATHTGVRSMKRLAVLVLAFLAISHAPLSGQEATLVDAGGHRIEMLVTSGPGPNVVFEGGAVSGIGSWRHIADSIALHAGTVRYARAGFGTSEVGPAPRTAHRFATELHTALENAGVEFPIVLVSYSLGGLLSMGFADLYPTDLAGLVFIDPATDRTYQRMLDERPKWLSELIEEVLASVDDIPPGWRGQMESLTASIDELSRFGPVTGVHSVVITAMTGRGEWPKATDQDMQEWLTDHQALVEQIPGARHVVLQDAMHGNVVRDPAVIREILAVVEAVRR